MAYWTEVLSGMAKMWPITFSNTSSSKKIFVSGQMGVCYRYTTYITATNRLCQSVFPFLYQGFCTLCSICQRHTHQGVNANLKYWNMWGEVVGHDWPVSIAGYTLYELLIRSRVGCRWFRRDCTPSTPGDVTAIPMASFPCKKQDRLDQPKQAVVTFTHAIIAWSTSKKFFRVDNLYGKVYLPLHVECAIKITPLSNSVTYGFI